MDEKRRDLIGRIGATTLLGTALVAGWVRPTLSLAAWNQRAFNARRMSDARRALGIVTAAPSGEIMIDAPELSENAAFVPVEITSTISETDSILVFVERNTWPYVARFDLSPGALPFVAARLRLAESSQIHVVVVARGNFFTAARRVSVTLGGCTQDEAVAAPSKPLDKPERTRIRARLRGDIADVLVLVRHPMENGLRKASGGLAVPEHYIRNVSVQLNGRPVIEAELGRGVSANPLLKFKVKDAKRDDRVIVRWRDSMGLERTDEARIVTA